MAATTLRSKPARQGWYRDLDGTPAFVKAEGDKLSFSFDLSNEPPVVAGATISSVSWSAEGPTLSGAAVASPSFSVTVVKTGDAVATITLSTGEILERRYRWIPSDAFARRTTDYRYGW